MSIVLSPMPQKMTVTQGTHTLDRLGYVSVDDRALLAPLRIARQPHFPDMEIVVGAYPHRAPAIVVNKLDGLHPEGYRLSVTPTEIVIRYTKAAGAFYAFMTLNQLYTLSPELPCLEIEDEPDFPLRGYMWDVARNKIPKLETILDMIDRIAALKFNHLELYMEGAPFAYPSFPEMWEGADVLTGDELMTIDAYCKERFIDFVPNHNTFGHMTEWLKKLPREMAICPDGFYYEPWGAHFPHPTSLNPYDERSIDLVRRMSDDLLACYSSDMFNVCCDEVLELGCGVTAGQSHEELGKTYYGFLMKLYEYCRERGKTMLYWGDIIGHHPELIPQLPKDAIALNWGYEATEVSEESCVAFEAAQVPYCVCPGTGSWKTFTGKTGQMLGNIRTSVENGRRHNAMGVLLTDWGDNGHLQGWATALPGLTYASALSWGYENNRDMDLAAALSIHVLGNTDPQAGQCLLDIGNWHTMETVPLVNQTVTERIMTNDLDALELWPSFGVWECFTHEQLDAIVAYVEDCAKRLSTLNLSAIPHADTVVKEYQTGAMAVKLGQLCGHYKLYLHEENTAGQKRVLEEMRQLIPQIIVGYRTTWIVKNRYSGLDTALEYFLNKQASVCEYLDKLGDT